MKRIKGVIPAAIIAVFSIIAVFAVMAVPGDMPNGYVFAEDAAPTEAEDLEIEVYCPGAYTASAIDRNETTFAYIPDSVGVTVSSGSPISSLYIEFDRVFGKWSLSDGSVSVECGQNGFLHEYVDVAEAFGYSPTSVTLTFSGGTATVSEIYALSAGTLPSWVQVWEPPCEEADLVLFSTHIDDEQLFFAGILPYYAGELGYQVEVVYFTSPYTYHDRPHEQLNGLWTVGVRNYPVEGELIDSYSENAADAYSHQSYYGFSRDYIVQKQVEALRRFRPHVVVGHDANGEYGHGQHIINSETLREALPLAADESYDPETAEKYGVWDTPKAYIHLWQENEIIMNWDIPLEKFGGKTAFQVTQDGFMCHKSQHWTWFYGWIYGPANNITKASEILTYSPCRYGLFRSTVGADVKGGDMFENIPMSYAEIAAEEERQRLEESRAESERVSLEESILASESESIEESRLESEAGKNTTQSPTGITAVPPGTEGAGGSGSGGNGGSPKIVGIIMIAIAAVVCVLLLLPQLRPKKAKNTRNNQMRTPRQGPR